VALSTAQWVSLAILAGVLVHVMRRRGAAVATATAAFLLVVPSSAHADEPIAPPSPSAPPAPPPAPAPAPAPEPAAAPAAPAAAAPATAPTPSEGAREDEAVHRSVTLRAAISTSQTLARPDVPSGWAGELDALYRVRLGPKSRIDLGVEGRLYENTEARHTSAGLVGELVYESGRHFEVLVTLVPHHTWFDFKSDFFTSTNAYGVRYALGAAFPFGPVVFGGTPAAFNTTSSTTVGVITQWEPRLWAGFSF
jgi:hypothetical protein